MYRHIDDMTEYQLVRYIIYKLRRMGYRKRQIQRILKLYQ